MRVFIKEQLISMLDSIHQIHNFLTVTSDGEQIVQLLTACQQAAITIGETVEKDLPDDKLIVSLLEKYCEEVFLLSQSPKKRLGSEDIHTLDKIINIIQPLLSDIRPVYHILFMPYKASMWDSLESIWRACKEDARCECYVMPIPYYEFNAEKKELEYCYEGNQFPEDVPIVGYKEYSLERNRPDVAYIHNPYDDRNRVTSVHPAFYSDKLKQYIRNLVYVPYYVTGGFIAEEHLELPVYPNMDYMIVQSEYAKTFCEGKDYYNKLLPLGSPKLDKVIRFCGEGAKMPEEWKPLLNGKKILMLNTSIGCFLQDGRVYLEKIKYICEIIKLQNQVALIWRPHPLLEATIKSMRPHLLSEYNDLKVYFMENKIGVLDKTPDISRAVAISDGYIGEEGTSVINLFGAAGKPIFILNNYITGSFSEEEKRRIHITGMVEQGDELWLTTSQYNAVFYMDSNTRQVHYMKRIEQQPKWNSVYPFLTAAGRKLFVSPNLANQPAVYNMESEEMKLLGTDDKQESLRCRKLAVYENQVFYLPTVNNYIMQLDMQTGEVSYHTNCIQELKNGKFTNEEAVFEYASYDEELWLSATYTNRVLQFHLKDGSYQIHSIGSEENGYSGIAADEKYLWLAKVQNGDIARWDRFSGEVRTFRMPEGFRCWQSVVGRNLAHICLIDMGQWIITIPGFSNGMVKLHKATGEASLLLEDFWKNAQKKRSGYYQKFLLSSTFGAKMSKQTVMVQRNCDAAAAIIDVESEECESFYPSLTEEDFIKLMEGEDGFEKTEKKSGFFRRESKIFSLEGFMDDLVNDRLKDAMTRQLKELSTLAANLDGSCGIKVHEYMMSILEKKD